MATTDEALQKKQDHVVDLRQKVAAAHAKREQSERELVNDIAAEALDAEAVSLEAELAEAKRVQKHLEPVVEAKPAAAVAPAATSK